MPTIPDEDRHHDNGRTRPTSGLTQMTWCLGYNQEYTCPCPR